MILGYPRAKLGLCHTKHGGAGGIISWALLTVFLVFPNFPCAEVSFVCLFVCLLGVIRAYHDFFFPMELSSLPMKGCKFWPMLGTHVYWWEFFSLPYLLWHGAFVVMIIPEVWTKLIVLHQLTKLITAIPVGTDTLFIVEWTKHTSVQTSHCCMNMFWK